ncbi:RNA polymerase sigma factor [Sorangium sp. So ce341]|uniref:RNA polymerase sigma factor n=1 Tax=Sorangium sp. So ce341 TaxID=3133302 RepID=UPI003F601FDB
MSRAPSSPPPVSERAAGELTVEALYDAYADYVYRSLRRLGVVEANLPDALQEVFVVVHRRLGEFHAHAYVKQWLFVIALRIARNYRRTLVRRRPEREALAAGVDPDSLAAERSDGPFERAAQAEEIRLFYALLETLDDDKREVFVLAELEQMSVPEIADTLSLNVNTVYSRLRAARQAFERALSRRRAQQNMGSPR